MELSLMKHKTLENTPEITCVSRQLKIMFYFGFFLDGVSPTVKTWSQKNHKLVILLLQQNIIQEKSKVLVIRQLQLALLISNF